MEICWYKKSDLSCITFLGWKVIKTCQVRSIFSVDPLDDVMKDFIVITTANIDIESFVTPKDSCPSDFKNELGPVDENENLEEGQGNIFEVFLQEHDMQGEVCTFFTVLFVVFISCVAEIFKQ